MALLYSGVPISQHAQYQDPETESSQMESSNHSFSDFHLRFSYCDMSKSPPWKVNFILSVSFFSLTLTLSVRYSSQLLNARVFLISDERCKAPLVYGSVLDNSMFCAGTLRGGIDSCQVCMFLNVKKCCDYSFLLATVLVLDMCNMHSPLSR